MTNSPEKGRKLGDPNYAYTEQPKKKSEPGVIDQVIVSLKGSASASFTKLARRFNRAKRIKQMLEKEEAQLNARAKSMVDDIFDASDEAYTRVVETASLVFKVSKAETRTKTYFDQAGYIAELEQLTGIAAEELEQIQKKYTQIKEYAVSPKLLGPKEKTVKESSNTDLQKKIQEFSQLVKQLTDKRLESWDRKFQQQQQEIESILDVT